MNCPYCGNPMDEGVVQSRDGLYWTAKARPVAALPLGGKERIDLTYGQTGGLFSGYKAAAFRCKECKKVILSYRD